MESRTTHFWRRLTFENVIYFQPTRYVLEVVKKIRSRYVNVSFILASFRELFWSSFSLQGTREMSCSWCQDSLVGVMLWLVKIDTYSIV